MSVGMVLVRLQLPELTRVIPVFTCLRKARVWVLTGWAVLLDTKKMQGPFLAEILNGLRKHLLAPQVVVLTYRTLANRKVVREQVTPLEVLEVTKQTTPLLPKLLVNPPVSPP